MCLKRHQGIWKSTGKDYISGICFLPSGFGTSELPKWETEEAIFCSTDNIEQCWSIGHSKCGKDTVQRIQNTTTFNNQNWNVHQHAWVLYNC